MPVYTVSGLDTGFTHNLVLICISIPPTGAYLTDRQRLTAHPEMTNSQGKEYEWWFDIDAIIIEHAEWVSCPVCMISALPVGRSETPRLITETRKYRLPSMMTTRTRLYITDHSMRFPLSTPGTIIEVGI